MVTELLTFFSSKMAGYDIKILLSALYGKFLFIDAFIFVEFL